MGEWGTVLATPRDGHCWAEMAVRGVTDWEGMGVVGEGRFWKRGSDGGEV